VIPRHARVRECTRSICDAVVMACLPQPSSERGPAPVTAATVRGVHNSVALPGGHGASEPWLNVCLSWIRRWLGDEMRFAANWWEPGKRLVGALLVALLAALIASLLGRSLLSPWVW
jgi:hypothetical protein